MVGICLTGKCQSVFAARAIRDKLLIFILIFPFNLFDCCLIENRVRAQK